MIEQKYKDIFIQLIEQGLFDQALLLSNELSQSFPDEPEGYNMVADAFRLKGDFSSAQKFYSLSLVKEPKQPHVLVMLGEVYISLGLVHEADSTFCDALELAPEDTHVLYKCGFYYMGKGEIESAEHLFNQAIKWGLPKAYNGLLDLYVFINDQQKIKHILDTKFYCLAQDSLSIGRAYSQINKHQDVLKYLEAIKIEVKSPPWLRCYYNLLGSTLDKLQRYEEAFEAYEKQNKNSLTDYTPEGAKALLQGVLDAMAKHTQSIPKDKAFKTSPLFILGAPRSGSSLIEQILNADEYVVSGGELNFIASALNTLLNKENDIADIAKWYREKLEFYIKENPLKDSVKWVTDKMPANWQYVEFILTLLPDAKIIYSKRNAMDIGLSIFKQNLISAHPYATQIDHIAHHIHLVETTMQHWIKKFPNNILVVDYEALVSDFDTETKKIMQFLNLEWDAKLSTFYKNEKLILTASRDQVRQPIYNASVYGYKKYGHKLSVLKQCLKQYDIEFN